MINQDAKKNDSINHRSLVIQKYIWLRFFFYLFFSFFVLIIVVIITRPETDLTVHFGFISGKKYIYIEFELIQFFELKKKFHTLDVIMWFLFFFFFTTFIPDIFIQKKNQKSKRKFIWNKMKKFNSQSF